MASKAQDASRKPGLDDANMAYHSWLQCVRGCDGIYSIYDTEYRCQTCGGLLDVEHDLEAEGRG